MRFLQNTNTAALDMVDVLSGAYDLADLICESEAMLNYITSKAAYEKDEEAKQKVAEFNRIKEEYDDVQRFGKWHPDFYRVYTTTGRIKKEMDQMETVSNFKKAEAVLDELLYYVSKTLADAVSDTIIVPSSNPFLHQKSQGCGTGEGGGCGCK